MGAVHGGRTGTRRGFLRGFPSRGRRPKPTHPALIPGVLTLNPNSGNGEASGVTFAVTVPEFRASLRWPLHGVRFGHREYHRYAGKGPKPSDSGVCDQRRAIPPTTEIVGFLALQSCEDGSCCIDRRRLVVTLAGRREKAVAATYCPARRVSTVSATSSMSKYPRENRSPVLRLNR